MESYVEGNRTGWDAYADRYQDNAGEFIAREPAWGVWQIPETELQVLGDVAGLDVLELGCGAAQWSIALARQGARVTGLDFSERQLGHARDRMRQAGVDFPLIQASATEVPLPDASFDVVFCDHGAFTFTDPRETIPEAARLLRPGGLLAFSMITAFADAHWREEDEEPGETLVRDYFGIQRFHADDGIVSFTVPYGEWIRLLVENGLEVLALLELQRPADAESPYVTEAGAAWARRWPYDHVWKARKRAAA